jgi:hypothetical protein
MSYFNKGVPPVSEPRGAVNGWGDILSFPAHALSSGGHRPAPRDHRGAPRDHRGAPRDHRGASAVDGIGDMFSSIVSGVKDAASGALTFYGNQKAQEGQIAALQTQAAAKQAEGGMPDWLLPVGLLGAGIGTIIYLKKRKKK